MLQTDTLTSTAPGSEFLGGMLRWVADHPLLETVLAIAAVVLVAWLADILTKRLLIRWINHLTRRTRLNWDDALRQHRVFRHLAHAVPAGVLFATYRFVPGLAPATYTALQNLTAAVIVIVLIFAIGALLDAANTIYEQYPIARTRPIKGYLQVAKIALYFVGAVVVFAIALGESPLLYVSGIGAMTAILMLVFKDTILSLVAGVQITQTDLIRVGDWIEMPKLGADGDVIDISLYTVRVQNWDKTVTGIPTHKFLTDSFRNWRSMSESGGRRIKRSVFVDTGTIRFLTPEEVDRFRRFKLLDGYIASKESELAAYNEELDMGAEHVNMRRLTNVGTFRAYVFNYLKNHPKVHDGMTLLVRQQPSGPDGLPIELYFFSNDTDWSAYEGIQADIFDHIMAIVPEFGLRLYQRPSGYDMGTLGGAIGNTRESRVDPPSPDRAEG